MAVTDLLDLVGNKPLVELKHLSPKPGVRIFSKLEVEIPTCIINDRIALQRLPGYSNDALSTNTDMANRVQTCFRIHDPAISYDNVIAIPGNSWRHQQQEIDD